MNDKPQQLLLVDDDAELAVMLSEFLELQGFVVTTVADGETALAKVATSSPDLIILDVMLPGINGFDVLKKLRETRETPVIMLTARGDEPDRILGLMEGADDYLTKPFSPLELAARVKAVLKRAGKAGQETADELISGPLRMNLARRELTVNENPVSLTAAEMRVLEHLMRHPDEVMSRAQLTELALNRQIEAYDRSVDTLVSKLRRKLATAGISKECIRGLRGHGYVLDSEVLRP
jgi:two-component system response regulator CpxR